MQNSPARMTGANRMRKSTRWAWRPRHVALLAACAACAPAADVPQRVAAGAYDVVIANGRVVDGAGNAWFLGDVGIRGDRIARITPAGMLGDVPATTRIDATGLVIAPGFIDIQSHSREQFLTGDGRVVSKIS